MADPSLYSPATTYPRRTFLEIQKSVGKTFGVQPSSMDAIPLELLKLSINDAVAGLMSRFPSIRGIGQDTTTLTIAAGDSSIELPTDFFAFETGATAVLLDENGADSETAPIMEKVDLDREFRSGRSVPYEDRQVPVLYLYGQSTNLQRIIGCYPVDSSNQRQFRVDYLRRLEKLVNDSDTLEAPPEFNVYINFRAASLYWAGDDDEKSDRFQAKAVAEMRDLSDPQAAEAPRPTRFRSFEEAYGYESFSAPNNQLPTG